MGLPIARCLSTRSIFFWLSDPGWRPLPTGSFRDRFEPAASPGMVRYEGRMMTDAQVAAQSLSPPLCPARYRPQSVAACPSRAARRILSRMGTAVDMVAG